MPPPNQEASPFSRYLKLACTVGTIGLEGCNTRETPVAKKAVPVPRGIFSANSCGRLPDTEEKFTPAFSNTPPFSNTRDRPPPPPSRDHVSSRKRVPSTSSSPRQM